MLRSSGTLKMPPVYFFILGLVVATVIANETTWTNATDFHNSINSTTTNSTTINSTTTNSPSITSIITSTTNRNTPSIYMDDANDTKSTAVPATTGTVPLTDGTKTTKRQTSLQTKVTTPAPGGSSRSTRTTTTASPAPTKAGSDSTGIIILIVLIIVVVIFLTACYLAHKRRVNRYSVDLSSRQDEANIPLSTMDPAGAAPQNGLTTFASTETTAKDPEEPEANPEANAEAQEEQKAETEGSAGDPTAESPAPAPESSEDKPKGDVVEQSPPAPVEPTAEDKTDDEAVVSNKTSVESLKETNENNSNNADFNQTRNLIFWEEVPLDCPV